MNPEPDASPTAALQAEIDRVRQKRDELQDTDLREALDMKLAQLEAKLAAMPQLEASPEPEAPLEPPTPAQLEQADVLIRQARVEKMRGNKSASTDILRQAVEAAPTAPSVLEALGDDLLERGQKREAREVYR